jgi:hypothetical protein
LPDKFDMESPAPDMPPEIARFEGAWIGTWRDDRHILVVERVTADGRANVVFAQSDSALSTCSRDAPPRLDWRRSVNRESPCIGKSANVTAFGAAISSVAAAAQPPRSRNSDIVLSRAQ